MNPWVVEEGSQWHLYYAGADDQGRHRICLATAPAGNPHDWNRLGPLFETGAEGDFDASWCVLPHVVRPAPNRWHLYYTGNSGHGAGLSRFRGIGLATSSDGSIWRKHPGNPILRPTGRDGDPDAIGIAGGSVLQVRLPDGGSEWRFYYTGCPTIGRDVFLDQQKTICLAVSTDGIEWARRGAVMLRDHQRDYQNVGVAGPVVQQQPDGSFRMWYSAIGTRWGYYSIGHAESNAGIQWRRGVDGDNPELAPTGTGWEAQMVEYPSVIGATRCGCSTAATAMARRGSGRPSRIGVEPGSKWSRMDPVFQPPPPFSHGAGDGERVAVGWARHGRIATPRLEWSL